MAETLTLRQKLASKLCDVVTGPGDANAMADALLPIIKEHAAGVAGQVFTFDTDELDLRGRIVMYLEEME